MSSIITPRARLSYAYLFDPRADKKGVKKYSTALIFNLAEVKDTPEFKRMQAEAQAAAQERFGNKAATLNLKNPFRNGAEKDGEGYGPGTVYINVSTTLKPELRDERMQPIIDSSELGSGDYVRASLSVYAYDTDGNRGVSFGLRNIQRLAKGEPLGGRTSAENDFEPVQSDQADGDSASFKSMFS